MPDPVILETLKAFPPYEGMPPRLLERLAELGTKLDLRPRDRILSADDEVRAMYLVHSGGVLLERRDETGGRPAHLLRVGQSFGEVPVLLRMPTYTFDASATEYGTELVEIAAEPFLELFETEHELPAFLVATLSWKILMCATRVTELSITSAATRLARYLLREHAGSDGDEVEVGMDRKDLAATLAITPEHLSRLLRRWADAGLVLPRGRSIALLRPELLAAIADHATPESTAS